MKRTILIVDDEPTQLAMMEAIIQRYGYAVETAEGGAAAIERIAADHDRKLGLILLDLSMPEVSGLDVLKKTRNDRPDLAFIVLTAHASLSNVVEAMKYGATDFLSKPASNAKILTAIDSAMHHDDLVGDMPFTKRVANEDSFETLIGDSKIIKKQIKMAQKAALSTITVLLEGESGVGKEVFARAIHQASNRRDRQFVAVNCGAIPANLVESILFGHEKGAFSGATDRHQGKFEEAHLGTLFLDEIGELPLDTQVKLLRALETGEIDRVGGRQPINVDIRLISATNRSLSEDVKAGLFREDLYYRLNVFPIMVPPLRERPDDIPLLARHFMNTMVKDQGLGNKSLTFDAMEHLKSYAWPGNVRQLQNTVFRAAVMADTDQIDIDSLPEWQNDQPLNRNEPNTDDSNWMMDADGELKSMEDIERDVIKKAIEHYDSNMSEVAKRLKIGRSTLYRKIETYGLK